MGSSPSSSAVNTNYDYAQSAPDAHQYKLLQASWSKAVKEFTGNESALGQHIFSMLLKRGKKIRILFQLDNLPEEKLAKSPVFIYHSGRLQQTLEKMLTLTDMRLVKEAQRLAHMHYKTHKNGFNPMYWSIFPLIVDEIMAPYCDLPDADQTEVQAAWSKFAQHIVDIMQAAYITFAKKGEARPTGQK